MPSNSVLYLLLGTAAGVFSGIFGIGGGIILIPLLIFGFGYSQTTANGTSLVALLLPVGLLGVYAYYQAGKINTDHIKVGLLIALGLFIGAYLGARLAVLLPEAALRRAFSVLLVGMGIKLWFSA